MEGLNLVIFEPQQYFISNLKWTKKQFNGTFIILKQWQLLSFCAIKSNMASTELFVYFKKS